MEQMQLQGARCTSENRLARADGAQRKMKLEVIGALSKMELRADGSLSKMDLGANEIVSKKFL